MAHVDPAVADADRMVAEEMARFRAALPSLLEDPALAGKWVVFKDGDVVEAFDDRTEGYHWAVEHLGRLSGFVLILGRDALAFLSFTYDGPRGVFALEAR